MCTSQGKLKVYFSWLPILLTSQMHEILTKRSLSNIFPFAHEVKRWLDIIISNRYGSQRTCRFRYTQRESAQLAPGMKAQFHFVFFAQLNHVGALILPAIASSASGAISKKWCTLIGRAAIIEAQPKNRTSFCKPRQVKLQTLTRLINFCTGKEFTQKTKFLNLKNKSCPCPFSK